MNKNIIIIILLLVISAIAFFTYRNARYVLNDDDQAVVTQSGKIIGDSKIVSGEYYKIPFFQEVHFFTKKNFLSESSQEIPTKDNKLISLKTRAFWKISNPILFYQCINSYDIAKGFVLDHTGAAERNIITSHTLPEIVGNDHPSEFMIDFQCRRNIEQEILDVAKQPIALTGISLNNIEAKITYPRNAE